VGYGTAFHAATCDETNSEGMLGDDSLGTIPVAFSKLHTTDTDLPAQNAQLRRELEVLPAGTSKKCSAYSQLPLPQNGAT